MDISGAKLYWVDDQDSTNAGWWFRFRDRRGCEASYAIAGDHDAGNHELAAGIELVLVYAPLLHASGTIVIYRGDVADGRIVLVDGKVMSWGT